MDVQQKTCISEVWQKNDSLNLVELVSVIKCC